MYELCEWFFRMVFFFCLSCFSFRKRKWFIFDFMSMTLCLCILFTNKEWFIFFLFYPMLDSMSCSFFSFFRHGLLNSCWAWHKGLLCIVGKQKKRKKYHNLIPSPATLSHTRSYHSFPPSGPLQSKTAPSPLDPVGIHPVPQ
jgi:hypothetical protein